MCETHSAYATTPIEAPVGASRVSGTTPDQRFRVRPRSKTEVSRDLLDLAFAGHAPYTAPSGGPPSWNLYRIACEQAFGVGSAPGVNGATKWTFA